MAELSRRADVSTQSVYRHEAQSHAAEPEVLARYAEVTGTTEAYLQYGEGDAVLAPPPAVDAYLASALVSLRPVSPATADKLRRLPWLRMLGREPDLLDVQTLRELLDRNAAADQSSANDLRGNVPVSARRPSRASRRAEK